VKYLVPGLLMEGLSDEQFLAPILRRELEARGLDAGFDVGDVRTDAVRTVSPGELVYRAAARLFDECQVVVVHQDHRERDKIDRLRAHLGDRGRAVVGLVPVRETEVWVLAALHSLENVPGFDRRRVPTPLRTLESDPDPKATLKGIYSRGNPMSAFNRVAESVDLDVLLELPAYRSFMEHLTNALKELRFL
jgi:hypothetical protein